MITILFLWSNIIIKQEFPYYKPLLKKLWYKIKPFLTWRILICFAIGWMITNGWCYIFIGLGTILHLPWMRNIGLGYAAFLYFPATIEKPVTFAIAIWIHKRLFPKHSVEVLETAKKKASPERSKK